MPYSVDGFHVPGAILPPALPVARRDLPELAAGAARLPSIADCSYDLGVGRRQPRTLQGLDGLTHHPADRGVRSVAVREP